MRTDRLDKAKAAGGAARKADVNSLRILAGVEPAA
jgi:hypothetical protein